MMTDSFFRNLATSNMSEPEAVVHQLRIEREALLRLSFEYYKARQYAQLDVCRADLVAVNTAIALPLTYIARKLAT
jgi:hypothetical protein